MAWAFKIGFLYIYNDTAFSGMVGRDCILDSGTSFLSQTKRNESQEEWHFSRPMLNR